MMWSHDQPWCGHSTSHQCGTEKGKFAGRYQHSNNYATLPTYEYAYECWTYDKVGCVLLLRCRWRIWIQTQCIDSKWLLPPRASFRVASTLSDRSLKCKRQELSVATGFYVLSLYEYVLWYASLRISAHLFLTCLRSCIGRKLHI